MKLKLFLFFLAAGFLCQCSKEGDEENFKVTLSTTSPLIRNVERSIGDTTVSPNWFNISFSVTNNTDKYVKIEEVYFYYTVNGVESKSTYDLGIMTRTDEGGNTYTYVDYCTYVPQGTTQAFSACRTGAKPLGCAAGDSTCDQPADSSSSTAPYAASLNMYIGGLPDQASKSSVYPIRMELVGSFKATANGEDIDRFNKREYFTTR